MADVAFEATGTTLEEMFISAADAMMCAQIQDLGALETKAEKRFVLKAADIERLLHDFLQELIFLKDAEQLLFSGYRLSVAKVGGEYTLDAACAGEMLDPKKHNLLVDVKAVSWHKFKVEKTDAGWKAVVIIDV